MTAYPLSRETWIKPTHLGVKIYTPVDPNEPEQENPYAGFHVLDNIEMMALIGWWCEQQSGTDQTDDLIAEIVEAVYDRRVSCRVATAALRALVVCEVAQALAGWVGSDVDEGEGLT
jgi:hypothetical protein